MNNTIPRAFFAYPSHRQSLQEAIRFAIPKLNASGLINIKAWEEYATGGKLIINTICQAIDGSKLFFADLTGLNHNVMFELGYAIARDKRIWLIFDDSIKGAKKEFEQLRVLTTIGYVSCSNDEQIVAGFYRDKPYASIKETIFQTEIKRNIKPSSNPNIMHLKSDYQDQAAVVVSNLLQKKFTKSITIDDPRESTVQSLAWYGSNVFNCSGVVCHLMSPNREGADLQTARHALVCGMAYGWDKPLLMFADNDFSTPIDYRDIVKHYNDASTACAFLEDWLPPVEDTIKVKQEAAEVQPVTKLAADLENLRFGEHIAENEERDLINDFFIPTAAYNDALRGNQIVFVGRKGSGKTANLLKLENELSNSIHNIVCVIKPERYQIQGIVDLLRHYQNRKVKGYTIESLWKFLLLTEIANETYKNLDNPLPGQIDTVGNSFQQFVNKNEDIIRTDFSTRLENCTQTLKESNHDINSYLPVSEELHSGILKQLRVQLGELFLSKKQKVVILVDNLDQAWERQNNIHDLSEILWGLLEVARKLPDELQRQDSRRHSIQLSLAIFLRSDIYYKISQVSPEPDKIPRTFLRWNDDLLSRIIEERFRSSFQPPLNPEVLWQDYFCPSVDGISTKEYITRVVLKRPRDIIYLVNAAVTTAINNSHPQIEEEDIKAAERQYSQYALEIANVENTLPEINIENVLYEFVGMPAILSKSVVEDKIQTAEISEDMLIPTLDVLFDLSFLGYEVDENQFVYPDTPEESRKKEKLAERYAQETGKEVRYQIHKAFRSFLEIQ